MNIESRVTIPFILALLLTAACTKAKPRKPEVIERTKPAQTMLTSSVPDSAPKPIEEKKPEPAVADSVEAPPSEAEPMDEPRYFEPELEPFDGLEIQRLVTAPEVEGREPLEASSVFGPHGERVYAFVEVSNASEEDKTVLVHFIGPDGQVSGGIELRIPATAPRWRTWAYTRHAKKPGLWRVEIRSKDGTLIGALPFEVETGC